MKLKIPILFVIANASLSGAERQLLLLASYLDRTKFNAEVCCLEGEGTFTEEVVKAGLPLHIIERRGSFDVSRLYKLIKLIKRKKYQIVHSFTWSANQYSRLARLFMKFKLVSGERGRDLESISMENIIDSLLSPLSDQIVFNTHIQAQKYLKGRNINKNLISVIYNGIDIEKFQNNKKKLLKSSLGMKKDIILIGTVGNFTDHKNFGMFIDICNQITPKNSFIHFIAIGDGKKKDYYARVIKERGLEKKLTLYGRRKDIEKVISGLDIFLLTSNWEGMPNVILEAMASGVPVISTNVDGCKEIIQDGINGFLTEPNDVKDMILKINILLKDQLLRSLIIQNALQTIISEFSLDSMVHKYDQLYDSLITNVIESD